MKNTLWSKIRAAHFCFIERIRAFLAFFPLDLYALTIDEVQYRMSAKEPPVVFLDPTGILKETYKELVSFDEFSKTFREVVLPAQKK